MESGKRERNVNARMFIVSREERLLRKQQLIYEKMEGGDGKRKAPILFEREQGTGKWTNHYGVHRLGVGGLWGGSDNTTKIKLKWTAQKTDANLRVLHNIGQEGSRRSGVGGGCHSTGRKGKNRPALVRKKGIGHRH